MKQGNRKLKWLLLIVAFLAFAIEGIVYFSARDNRKAVPKEDSLIVNNNNKGTVSIDTFASTPLKKPQKQFNLDALKMAYIDKVNSSNGDRGYFLFDIDDDEIPELWTVTGDGEAFYMLSVYKFNNENGKVELIYQSSAEHTYYQQGQNYIIAYTGHMGWFEIAKLSFANGRLRRTVMKKGQTLYKSGVDDDGNPVDPYYPDYPVLSEPEVQTFEFENIRPIKKLSIHM